MPESLSKPRGRPRKSAFDRLSAQVTVRFKVEEAVRLDGLAAEAGLTASEYLRMQAFGASPAPQVGPGLRNDVYQLLLAVRRGLRDGLPAPIIADRMGAVLDRLQQ